MKKTEPLVSIVVPAYCAEKNIGIFINSVLKQTYKNIELVVVNDGSKDKTKDIVEAFLDKPKDFKIKLVNQENQGMAKARNNGYLNSEGNYVWFLDSDMEFPFGYEVEKCVQKCLNEDYAALMIPEKSKGIGFWAKCRGFEKIINNYDINKNAVRFLKREILDKVGFYDPSLTAAEDYEFHNRVKNAGFKYCLIKEIFIYHYEVDSIQKMFKKAFNYGQTMPLYIKKYPKESFQQFFIVRQAYFKNWKFFLKNPILGLGLLMFKIIQYFAAALGMFFACFKKKQIK